MENMLQIVPSKFRRLQRIRPEQLAEYRSIHRHSIAYGALTFFFFFPFFLPFSLFSAFFFRLALLSPFGKLIIKQVSVIINVNL
ncbi:hypothetical protein PUN28_011995 [Cardiocondyla obscurior]|uniref:Uncharacterized protein n=1 Tax=Cardiocondyla obscurior TaxID=286306 RepID=A0AAW2FD55_9HYME